MKPILFLDIDGVLNSHDWMRRRVRPPGFENMFAWQKHAEDGIDPAAISRLNRIVAHTNCLVVVSSTWRKQYPLGTLNRIFDYVGFEYDLFGCTPSHYHEGPNRNRCERGLEINWWLCQLDRERGTFAIVDDDSDMEPHMDRLVQTDFEFGLTDERADRLIEMLG